MVVVVVAALRQGGLRPGTRGGQAGRGGEEVKKGAHTRHGNSYALTIVQHEQLKHTHTHTQTLVTQAGAARLPIVHAHSPLHCNEGPSVFLNLLLNPRPPVCVPSSPHPGPSPSSPASSSPL